MSLVTRCPKCNTDFLVSLDQLRVHDGLVRCGTCANIFDGYAQLESELPTLTHRAHRAPAQTDTQAHVQTLAQVHVQAQVPEIIPLPVKEPFFEPATPPNEPFFQNYPEAEPAPSVLRQRGQTGYQSSLPNSQDASEPAVSMVIEPRISADGDVSFRRRQPEFLSESEGTGSIMRIVWGILSLFALVALLVQCIYIYRNDIATHLPLVQPVLSSLCKQLNCDVSLSRHLERISIDATSLQQSSGQTQEGQPVEFTLRFTMRNRYDKNQPWPHLSLELKDASGATVVRKIIAPYQYLPSTLVDQPFAAAQEVNLLIPVTVNGLQINGFQLDKFFP
jgi:predicted Zn finger-like uncharacterized protein